MKIGILGAGVTGLSAARLLKEHFEVEVLERKDVCGGIARTRDVDGVAYHVVGGHCFNSKYPEVLDFVFNKVLRREEWNEIKRVSKIRFGTEEYLYPIEFSVKQIYRDNPDLGLGITRDFLSAQDDGDYENLANWFIKKFGRSLAELYFIPYNQKIWGVNPAQMDPSWVKDKLPIPDKYSFFEALLSDKEDNMPHARFFYPKSNNQNTFIDALAGDCNIKYGVDVHSIKYNSRNKKWVVDGVHEYDALINTLPLDQLPSFIDGTPEKVIMASKLLRYNSISNILWRTMPTDKTWTYLPEQEYPYHRYIHIGCYHRPVSNYSISESVGDHSYSELIERTHDPFLLEPLSYNHSEHAYVVFDENYHSAVPYILDYLSSIGIYSIGRFGEWQYYNMDVCIKRSMDLAKQIISNGH